MSDVNDSATVRLGDGTQEIPLRDAYTARCRCGSPLSWKFTSKQDDQPTAKCDKCLMMYVATEATVKIEGFDRSTQ